MIQSNVESSAASLQSRSNEVPFTMLVAQQPGSVTPAATAEVRLIKIFDPVVAHVVLVVTAVVPLAVAEPAQAEAAVPVSNSIVFPVATSDRSPEVRIASPVVTVNPLASVISPVGPM